MTQNTRPRTRGSIVLGTMDFGTAVDENRAFGILDAFHELGGRWLDTADCYTFWIDDSGVGGASERVLGRWLRARPGAETNVRVATKVGQNPLVPHDWPATAEGLSAARIRDAFSASLDRLGIDRVGMLWAHAQDRSVPLEETVETFGALVAEGLTERVGGANHPAWRVERARAIAAASGVEPWSAIQLRDSLLQPRPLTCLAEGGHRHLTPEDLDLAAEESLEVWAYSPLLFGGYVRTDKPIAELYRHPGTDRVLTVVDRITATRGVTRNQVVLSWLMEQGISPIVGGSQVQYVREAMQAQELILSPEELAEIEDAR